jgi:hypothetical protein
MALVAGVCIAAGPAPPDLRVQAPATVHANEPRDIAVTISNPGVTPMVALPSMIRLHIEGERAEYVPYPGPPIDPWEGVHELAAGASTVVVFRDTSDKRGVWRLPPGDYRIKALYEVPPELAPPLAIANPQRVWRGRVESPPASMTVRPNR